MHGVLLRVDGRVPFLAMLQLFHCYLIWAALHDIAQQRQRSYYAEYSFLVAVPFSMALLWYVAFQVLKRFGRIVWISAFAAWVLLLDYAAYQSLVTGWTRTNGIVESSILWASLPVLIGLSLIVLVLFRSPRNSCPHTS